MFRLSARPLAPILLRGVARAHLLLFPPGCRLCGRLLEPRERTARGYPHLCPACDAALPWHEPAWHCLGCARRTGEPHRLRCPACAPAPLALSRVRAVCDYTGPLRRWIVALKYYRQDALAMMLGAILARRLADGRDAPSAEGAGGGPADGLAERTEAAVDWVVPVPLHISRVRSRGFNQARLLAHYALRTGAAPPLHPALLRADLLVRHRRTRPQVEMPAAARRENVADAFSVPRRAAPGLWPGLRPPPPPEAVRDAHILLVDDVMTTGATLDACAQALRAAGARRVDALVVARA